jgi:hypothetical protein
MYKYFCPWKFNQHQKAEFHDSYRKFEDNVAFSFKIDLSNRFEINVKFGFQKSI